MILDQKIGPICGDPGMFEDWTDIADECRELLQQYRYFI